MISVQKLRDSSPLGRLIQRNDVLLKVEAGRTCARAICDLTSLELWYPSQGPYFYR